MTAQGVAGTTSNAAVRQPHLDKANPDDGTTFRSTLGTAQEKANQKRQLALRDRSSGGDACVAGFNTCIQYGERLYDLGWQAESHELYRNCRATLALCRSNENLVQTNPRVVGGTTEFPPEKARNGGGYVIHQKGRSPIYIPPSYDPLAGLPPR